MKKKFIKLIEFFKKNHRIKYFIEIGIFTACLAVLVYFAAGDVESTIYGTIVGFMISSLFLYIFKVSVGYMEDVLKVNFDTQKLLQIYNGNPGYRKRLESQGTTVEFAYADVLVNKKDIPITIPFAVEDHPEKYLELDDFIVENYAHIFSAHSNSTKTNFDTIRLDRFDRDTNTFYLSRSTYFNHLVTNRAVDFFLFDDITLRTIYEYGPRLSPLEESKMSNHIGINALVFLKDGRLLVPRRKADATISKNKVTSSIAVMLSFPDECKNDPRSATITAEYLLRDNIFKNLSDRVKLPAAAIDAEQTSIDFLGFGQNIYEGGKPQFYYAVTLHNIDTATYFAQRDIYFKENGSNYVIDADKCMYAAELDSYRFLKEGVLFNAYDEQGKLRKVSTNYEMSYLCNIWHYQQYNENLH